MADGFDVFSPLSFLFFPISRCKAMLLCALPAFLYSNYFIQSVPWAILMLVTTRLQFLRRHMSTDSKLIFAPSHGQYKAGTLDRSDLKEDPFDLFHEWFKVAQANCTSPEATTLSTAHLPSGRVSSRVLLLKELDRRGFVIYSNFDTSKKWRDIKSNQFTALTFWWEKLQRQIRVEGIAERLAPDESQVYFDTRPKGSRIGAWSSPQSSVLHERDQLESTVKANEERFSDTENIPVPPHWGGLRIVPLEIEFWQGRESRLHDRFSFKRSSTNESTWTVDRLAP